MATIRVALAEDNVLLREGVSRLVAANQDLELVGVASDLPELLDVIERCEPDVVVTDIRMPPTGRDEGIQAAAWLREHRPQVGRRGAQPVRRARLRRWRCSRTALRAAPTCSRSGWPAWTSWPRDPRRGRAAAR